MEKEKEEVKKEEKRLRQIIIETDGSKITLKRFESSPLELVAILETLLKKLKQE